MRLVAGCSSLLLHAALLALIASRASPPQPRRPPPVEIEVLRPGAPAPPPSDAKPAARSRVAVSRPIARAATGTRGQTSTQRADPEANPRPEVNERGAAAPAPSTAPDLFSAAALSRAVDAPDAPAGAYRPKRGVGVLNGVGVADFLAEDAARARAVKGAVAPHLRDLERRLERTFDPPFAHVDVANRRELFHKQLVGRLKTPPKLQALPRGADPTTETNKEKMKRIAAEPFFLGRRVEVYARQRADGTLLELSLRVASGFRAFDEDALDAVERALKDHRPDPRDVKGGEVRTLWRLEATGYVVYAATPTLVFDESSGKSEWIYPLEKRVDRKVSLIAVY